MAFDIGIAAERAGVVVHLAHAGQPLNDYNLRRIGSELEGTIRQLLQAGQLRYNPGGTAPCLFSFLLSQ